MTLSYKDLGCKISVAMLNLGSALIYHKFNTNVDTVTMPWIEHVEKVSQKALQGKELAGHYALEGDCSVL